jgi:hypothetical protein
MLRERSRLGGGGDKGGDDLANKTMLGISVQFADQRKTQPSAPMREIEEQRDGEHAHPVKLTIDGVSREPDTLYAVEGGDHVVRAEASGYLPSEKSIRVIAGAPVTEEIVLEPKPAQVNVVTEPGATVIVDGRGIGAAPVGKVPLDAGLHIITVLRSGRRPYAREINVTRAEDATVDIPLEATTRRRSVKWVVVGAGTLGVASLVFGGLALYADGAASDALAKLEAGNQTSDVLDDYRTYRSGREHAKTVMWITGSASLVVGLTAAWLYFFDTPSAEGVRVVPAASGSGTGAAIIGRF